MIEAIGKAFKVPDLKRRILFTLALIGIYRFGAHVPVPGVNIGALKDIFEQAPLLGFMDLFAGGALSNFAVFALGIMPYITASIIMQLLTVVIPTLNQWQKEGEVGQRKITQYTRYFTLGLALVQSVAMTMFFERQLIEIGSLGAAGLGFGVKALIIITLVAGTALIMWLGELITQRGIGNGMSILIFASIIARLPESLFATGKTGGVAAVIGLVVILLGIIVGIVFVEKAQRRIPVQYAKRVVGRKVYGGSSTYIPLKVNSAGVIPIIFASSLLIFPATFLQFLDTRTVVYQIINKLTDPSGALYLTSFAVLVIFFTYFYTAIIFNPIDISDNMKKNGGFIPGVRPGKPTAGYIDRVLTRITLPGAFFLATVAILPTIIGSMFNIPFFQRGDFSGISLLIIVGVALELMRQIESQLLMRHYEGFLK
ncbi:MAG: preprotein translocase subunit SecY [Actinobacteria bacterium]|nr:preprotein translocase subunit SecY [Actinomycetota bacterium]